MNKNLLIILVFLLFNIGYGQGGTINTSAPVLASINTVYGTASNSDSFLVSGTNIDQRIEVSPPLGFEVSRNGTVFTDTVIVNTPTGGRGDIAATLIYIRLKGTIPAKIYGGVYFSLTSPGAEDVEVFMSPSTVNKGALTILADNKSKMYGDSNPDLTASYSGFVPGDDIRSLTTPIKLETIADKTSGAGIYNITVTGGESSNYIIYGYPGKLTIKKVPLTITTIDNSKVYGSVNPVLAINYNGFITGESETNLTTKPTIATTAVTGSAVGKYAITASGAVSSNYEITYDNKGFLTVTPAKLTITTIDNSKVYGSVNPVLAINYNGFITGESETNLTAKPTIATTAVTGSAVGKYAITAGGAVSSNYEITYDNKGFLTVTPAKLTITTIDNSKVYGSVNPVLAINYNGFITGESETNLTTKPTIATTAVTGSAVGKYAITASGAVSSNYEITYDNKGGLTVTPAKLTITTIDNSKVYGSVNPVLAVSYDGFISGESEANLITKPTIATTAVTGSAVGKYAITASGAVSSNYEITYDNKGFLTVTPAKLTITTIDNSKVYGSVNPVLVVSYNGFISGESEANLTTKPTIATTAVTGSAVGKYAITASGAVSSNYEITYDNKGILDVTPATLTIKADDKKREHGIDNPVLTVSYVGFVSGDTEANLTTKPTIATVAVKESPVGKYDITLYGATSPNYTIIFEKGILTVVKSSNSGLTDLAISEGTLSPAFTEGNTAYTATVPNDIKTINVTPVTGDTAATVTVNGEPVPSGTASGEIPLQVGKNEITTVITAQDGTTTTYTVIVTRDPSTNAGLSDIVISDGSLSPAFDTDTKGYKVEVPYEINTYVVNPIPVDPAATIEMKVDGKVIDPTAPIDLKVGDNVITIVVTAPDGTTKETYEVIVTRDPSANAGLSDIVISDGSLSPAFDTDTKGYKVEVPYEINTYVVNPIPVDPAATIEMKVDGKVIDPAAPIDLKVGDNVITIVVTAPDGTTKETYEVIVTRDSSNDAGLTDLAISEGTLSPAFTEGNTAYTDTVPNGTTTINVTPVSADSTATITVNGKEVPSGNASPELPLKVGENEIITKITAQDGTVKEYIIIVTREAALTPDNAGLSDIVISDGSLSPAFNTDTNDYRVDVPNETNSIVITPITIDPNSTVEMIVDGKTVDPSLPIDLNVGDNEITIIVTAPDGTKDTYVVIVDRADAVPQEIVPTNIITPNGDGKNDYWIIPGIEQYPNNSVKVFDRAARLVYSKNNYNNEWDGTYKGSPLNEDTYYYLIDLGSGQPKIKGFITIVRD